MNKNELTHSHSKSLWNYTLSPGWTDDEVFILKLALQKFGVGRWQRIVRSGCLPRKSVAQIYLQTQRIMGQQSLGDFMGLHVDIERIFLDNMKIKNVLRKNNCIINTGDNPTQDERSRKKQENRDRYGLSKQYVKEIKLPRENMSQFKDVVPIDDIDAEKLTTIEQIHLLNELRKAVDFKIQLLGKRGEEEYKPTFKNRGVMAPLKVDYWRIEKTPVIINLAKDDHGGYSVLQD